MIRPVVALLTFVVVVVIVDAGVNRYIGKYSPTTETKGNRIIHKYPRHTFEVTLSFGITEDFVKTTETLIEDNYTGELRTQGEEVNRIGQALEQIYGGMWSVAIFDDPYTFAYTVFKRSKTFIVYQVDDAGISIAKEL